MFVGDDWVEDNIPIAPCLCQHHGTAYAEAVATINECIRTVKYDNFADGTTIAQAQITITKRCCIVVNTAMFMGYASSPTDFEIERPVGTVRTTQEDSLVTGVMELMHHSGWEVLPTGTYTYYIVNRSGAPVSIYAAWIKVIASDCDG